jgi:hypothetical protein
VPADSTGLPPAGFGTLRQDDIALHLRSSNVELRLLPLDENIIRLLAPDAYQSLHSLLDLRSADVTRVAGAAGIRRPGVFLVTVFGLAPRAVFDPEDVTITSQNRFFRPAAIVPLTPRWSEQRLDQRETASALYLFEDGIALTEPLAVSWAGAVNEQWQETVRLLERERTRVSARAGTAPPP